MGLDNENWVFIFVFFMQHFRRRWKKIFVMVLKVLFCKHRSLHCCSVWYISKVVDDMSIHAWITRVCFGVTQRNFSQSINRFSGIYFQISLFNCFQVLAYISMYYTPQGICSIFFMVKSLCPDFISLNVLAFSCPYLYFVNFCL